MSRPLPSWRRAVLAPTALAAALASVAAASALTPPQITPRPKVEALAKAIDTRFFDAPRAHRIAAELRAEAKKGVYDKLTDPRDFAAALTERLRPLDGHFSVSWTPPGPTTSQRGPSGPPSFLARRGGYGFAAVRILPGNIGYIDMRGFAHFEPTGDQAVRRAADAALALVAGTDAVIFDLRENFGGSPAMVGYLIGHFTPDGAKIYNTFKTRGEPDGDEGPTVPITTQRRLETPLYVLTSGRTASAAESFAYTLQAAKRATVVGEASRGGANPGGSAPLDDGLSVFISSGTPINPITGTNWEGTGVIPDVPTTADEALAQAQRLALAKLVSAPLGEPALTENRWTLEALEAHPQIAHERLAAYAGGYGPFEAAVDGKVLVLRYGRQPQNVLTPLDENGLFFVEGAPSRRIQFDPDGLIFLSPDGSQTRQMRNGAAAAGR